MQLEMARRLALVAEYRDDATGAHAARVARTSAELARRLGLGDSSVEMIHAAAPLHDIGKVAIPDAILLKPGPLTASERATMERHTVIGARMLEDSDVPVLRVARDIALSHHERWDGSGYPAGLLGTETPLVGRIVGLADAFDALISERPYKAAWPLGAAVAQIADLAGSHFSPEVVAVFLELDHAQLAGAGADAPDLLAV